MARHEANREDLMREATALVRRAELELSPPPIVLVAGFRRDDSLSLFFEDDPVCHFDGLGRLKRAYVDGRLYRTQGTTLSELTRRRSSERTHLLRHDLTADELADFLGTINEELLRLRRALTTRKFSVIRQVPQDVDIVPELIERLDLILNLEATDLPIRLALRFPGKR